MGLTGGLLTVRDWMNQSDPGDGGRLQEMKPVVRVRLECGLAEPNLGPVKSPPTPLHAAPTLSFEAIPAVGPETFEKSREVSASQDRGIANWPMSRRPVLVVGTRYMGCPDRVPSGLQEHSSNLRACVPGVSGIWLTRPGGGSTPAVEILSRCFAIEK